VHVPKGPGEVLEDGEECGLWVRFSGGGWGARPQDFTTESSAMRKALRSAQWACH
jgi:hypothetical protein